MAGDPPAAAARGGAAHAPVLLLALALTAYAALQFGHLSYPLLWQDEGETVMFGQRVLEHGYPKVHGERNIVYGMGLPLAQAVDVDDDAYIGSLWGQYYFAAVGVWLASHSDDPRVRTALVRLPFALAGCVGLALLFLAAAPDFGDASSRRVAAAAFTLLLCLSTSLILHLREARYYPVALALLAAVVFVHSRARGPGSLPALALLLLLLFNVFYPAAVAAGLWIGLEAILRSRRGALPTLVALAAVAAAALPFVLYFRISSLAHFYSVRTGFGVGAYLQNLGTLAHYLLRYELLGPVILVKLLLLALPGASAGRVSPALTRLCLIYALVGARNPLFFERYYVPLSPLLSLILVLDGTSLARRVVRRARPEARGRALLALTVLFALGLAAMLTLKRAELAGHLAELRRPYRGPLDFIVAEIAARYPDTTRLQIATNYELEPLMYYLGSRVLGRQLHPAGERAAEEAAARVDVVIPRTRWPKKLHFVRSYLERGSFEPVELPVADLPFNNIPELFAGRWVGSTHRFRTVTPGGEIEPVTLYFRVEEARP